LQRQNLLNHDDSTRRNKYTRTHARDHDPNFVSYQAVSFWNKKSDTATVCPKAPLVSSRLSTRSYLPYPTNIGVSRIVLNRDIYDCKSSQSFVRRWFMSLAVIQHQLSTAGQNILFSKQIARSDGNRNGIQRVSAAVKEVYYI